MYWPLRHYRFVPSDYSNCFSLGTNVKLCRRLLQIGEWMETSLDRGCWLLFSKRVNENQNTQPDKCIEFQALAKQCGTSSFCSEAVINLRDQIVLTKVSQKRRYSCTPSTNVNRYPTFFSVHASTFYTSLTLVLYSLGWYYIHFPFLLKETALWMISLL